MKNINCKQWDKFSSCNKKPRWLGIFKRNCIEIVNLHGKCEIAERYPKPDISKIQITPEPRPQPISRYKYKIKLELS